MTWLNREFTIPPSLTFAAEAAAVCLAVLCVAGIAVLAVASWMRYWGMWP